MIRKGLLIVVSGPSGSGKSTLLKEIRDSNPDLKFSVSATTRAPRVNEIDGQNYFFKTVDEFKEMIRNNELLEWTEYCENFYGTPKKYVEKYINSGSDVILEIEVEGNESIRTLFPECVSIFILPPTYQELKRRIESRGTEACDMIKKRLDTARREMLCVGKYNYVVLNDDINKAVNDIGCIISAEKLKVQRNMNILNDIGLI